MNAANEGQADSTVTLVHRLRTGHPDAVRMLNRLYREPLLRFCWGYLGNMEEAEDALQDIWYKVLTTDQTVHTADPTSRFRPWLYKVARNHCLNVVRARARHGDGQAVPVASHLHASLTGHLTRLDKDERKSHLNEAVRSLPASQQEVLRLRYVEGLSRAEIAQVLDLTPSVVKSRLFEGLKKLREHASLLEDR